MDKYEYKHLVEQIQNLIDQGEYAEAAAIADRIDWRRVRSVMTLGTISDLYKINCRYEDARDVMLLAYDRKPENRQICYSLCELYIKTGEPVEAAEFYKEFEKLAPKDPGRYVLKYKLYDAYDVSLDEKIEVLEKLKAEDYQEKWMYELASLYHRRGLGTKCVEVCDEIILWFGTGKYVNMAMELKMLHEPLTAEQQKKYDKRFQQQAGQEGYQEPARVREASHSGQPEEPAKAPEELPAVEQHTVVMPKIGEGAARQNTHEWNANAVEQANAEQFGATRVFNAEEVRHQLKSQAEGQEDYDIQVKTVDVGQYNTMNLQAEIAAGLKEVLEGQGETSGELKQDFALHPAGALEELTSDSGPLDLPLMEDVDAEDLEQEPEEKKQPERVENSEVFFETPGETYLDENGYFHQAGEISDGRNEKAPKERESVISWKYEPEHKDLEKEALKAQPPETMAKVLTQEADGQLRLVIPESKNLEKQITGQLSIDDIRAEWERMKIESQAKQEEEARQQMLRQTGRMFTEFEEAIRDNILRQMEDTIDPESFAEKAGDSVPEEVREEKAPEAVSEPEPVKEAQEASQEEISEEPEEPLKESETEEIAEESGKTETDVELASDWDMEGIGEEIHEFQTIAKMDEAAEKVAEAPLSSEESVKPVREMQGELLGDDFTWGEEFERAENLVKENDGEEEKVTEEPEAEQAEESAKVSDEKDKVDDEASDDEMKEADADEEEETDSELPEEPVEERKEPNMFHRRSISESQGEALDDAGIEYESLSEAEALAAQDDSEIKERRFFSEEESDADEEKEDEQEEASDEDDFQKSPAQEDPDVKIRKLTPDEEKLYDPWIRDEADKDQFARAIDGISMAAYTGNVIITGEAGLNIVELAKKMIYEIKMSDSNFSGKVAKIPASALNKKDVAQLLDGLKNGALIVENAGSMPDKAAQDLHKNLQRENWGIIVLLLDTKKNVKKFLKGHEYLRPLFNVWLEIKPMSNEALAEFARQYAKEQEYSIDDLGTLALHMKIDEMQTARHAVNTEDVKEMMDDAIYSASRKTIGHFLDIIFGRRYDDEDMIIITEKDFQ